ncbi:MAG: hypothetical protein E7623_02505 [Ruminococcaceae bacterium]|nr:hypothetical protein [Oscillospiraceae bacterium]
MKKILFRVIIAALISVIFLTAAINIYMIAAGAGKILSAEEAAELFGIDCIMVLGASVEPDGSPSPMLEDRIIQGINVYRSGVCGTLLMSGDGRSNDYNEVDTMTAYALKSSVPAEELFGDIYGLSTYDSVYRVREIYGAKRIIVVTQSYHLYRALYIADVLGIEAYGVSADLRTYSAQPRQDVREVLARVKDFFKGIIGPESDYTIPSE